MHTLTQCLIDAIPIDSISYNFGKTEYSVLKEIQGFHLLQGQVANIKEWCAPGTLGEPGRSSSLEREQPLFPCETLDPVLPDIISTEKLEIWILGSLCENFFMYRQL